MDFHTDDNGNLIASEATVGPVTISADLLEYYVMLRIRKAGPRLAESPEDRMQILLEPDLLDELVAVLAEFQGAVTRR
jgi:hypothetical protein